MPFFIYTYISFTYWWSISVLLMVIRVVELFFSQVNERITWMEIL
jgi:hypothetical protein